MSQEPASPISEGTGGATLTRYRVDPGHSRFTVQAFAGGLLSVLAHSPTFAVRDYAGELRWATHPAERAGLWVTVRAGCLELVDQVRPADRKEIEGRMRREVLEAAAHPEIHFQSTEIATAAVAGNRYRLRITGLLAIRGMANRYGIEAELVLYQDGVRLSGEFPLRLTDYRIRPVTALGGAIRLRDQLRVSFDLGAWQEAP
jgi:polyisoprenoid-binding protein YceI